MNTEKLRQIHFLPKRVYVSKAAEYHITKVILGNSYGTNTKIIEVYETQPFSFEYFFLDPMDFVMTFP